MLLMIILSLNIRGRGGKIKTLNLYALLKTLNPDIILLQETMCSSSLALFAFSKILPSWEFCAISASGLSGGLFSTWNPSKENYRAY